jgi:hypothetical protein
MRVRALVALWAAWAVCLGTLAASASASPLEAPEVLPPSALLATSASLQGVLSPNAPGEPGASYQYVYRQANACKGAGEVETTEGLSFGEEHEFLPAEPITGLNAHSEYTACLIVHNAAKTEEAVSAPLHFLTGPPETPETQAATEATATAAKLHGVLDPVKAGNSGSYEFLYRQSATKCQGEGQGQTGGQGAMAGTIGQAVEAEVSELLPGSDYTACLLARSEAGETALGNAVTFTTVTQAPLILGEPQSGATVSSLDSSNESATSVDLDAKVVPGGATKYHFEYGTSTAYDSSTPEAIVLPAGTSATPVGISQEVTGLSANTTYHWRLVVENTAGKVESVDHTFVYDALGGGSTGCPDEAARQARGSLSLPDCRAYEMVTPPEKNGALVGRPLIGLEPMISNDGSRMISSSLQCFGGAESCIGQRLDEGAPYEFVRTPAGWVTHPLALAPGALEAETYATWGANANTGTLLLSALAPTPKQQEDMWLREAGGKLVKIGPLEEEGRYQGHISYQQLNQGNYQATADLSHFVYTELLPSWSFDPTFDPISQRSLYEYAGTGKSQPLMVAVKGGYQHGENHSLITVCATSLGGPALNAKAHGSLSQSGRTVYFEAQGRSEPECEAHSEPTTAPEADQVWARVDGEMGPEDPGDDEAHSVLISGPAAAGSPCTSTQCQKNSTEAPEDAHFEAATPDGSTAVFVSSQQLTDNASQSEGNNLYESVCSEPCGTPAEEPRAAGRELFDVSEAQGGAIPVGGPRVLGLEALSPDGSHVYFVAQGKLATNKSALGQEAVGGEDNLYLYERAEGEPKGRIVFIAALSPEDAPDWSEDVANVTPDGRLLVFTSHRALTADDTRGEGPAQVYEYDAQTSTLTRISIGQDGYNDNGNEAQLGSRENQFRVAGDARIVPAFDPLKDRTTPARSDPTMSDDGSFVFFQSPVALTPGALNDQVDGVKIDESGHVLRTFYAQNFYEYHAGHVSLLATVTTESGQERTTLLGSDASGSNVFFSTFEPLVPEDSDTQLDYYDARICREGGEADEKHEQCLGPVAPASPCGEGSCQGSGGSPQPLSLGVVPASQTFTGAGNLTPPPVASPISKGKTAAQVRAERLAKALKLCRSKHGQKRKACERAAHKAYAAKRSTAKKDAGNRRAK